MSLLEKLKTDILPKSVKEGRFGKDKVKFIDFKIDETYNAADQFSSSINFGDVITETATGDHVTQSVVIKSQAGGKLFQVAQQFGLRISLYNEFLFYTEILPLLCKCDTSDDISKIFPKYFYGSATRTGDPIDDLLIFENVQKHGFCLSPIRTFNDNNHIDLTLKWIGKFHALSLVCKKKYPTKFKEIVSKLIEPHWTEERLSKRSDNFYVQNCKRGILALQKDPKYSDKLNDLLAVVEETDISMAKLVTPVEPLAVICHGDFCRNNIFYKYNSIGVPCEVMFFDFATARYSSPVIDLSLFLCINTSPEVKSSQWDDIMWKYYCSLISSPDLEPEDVLTLQDVKLDYRRRGFYGYVHSSYFLPMMLSDEKNEEAEEWWTFTMEEITQLRLRTGGEKATFYLMQLVKHMIDENYDFKFIADFKLNTLR